jgi:hypothetical protein
MDALALSAKFKPKKLQDDGKKKKKKKNTHGDGHAQKSEHKGEKRHGEHKKEGEHRHKDHKHGSRHESKHHKKDGVHSKHKHKSGGKTPRSAKKKPNREGHPAKKVLIQSDIKLLHDVFFGIGGERVTPAQLNTALQQSIFQLTLTEEELHDMSWKGKIEFSEVLHAVGHSIMPKCQTYMEYLEHKYVPNGVTSHEKELPADEIRVLEEFAKDTNVVHRLFGWDDLERDVVLERAVVRALEKRWQEMLTFNESKMSEIAKMDQDIKDRKEGRKKGREVDRQRRRSSLVEEGVLTDGKQKDKTDKPKTAEEAAEERDAKKVSSDFVSLYHGSIERVCAHVLSFRRR